MSIKLVVGPAFSLDMSDFDFTGVDDAEITTFSSSTITGVAGSFRLTITGQGFVHDQNGYLTDGTVYSLSLTYHGNSMLSLSGADVDIPNLIHVLNTSSTKDDLSLLASTLSGDDDLSGSQYGDLIAGYNGNDTLLGKDGHDTIRGGSGNDLITGGAGSDDLWGNGGKDTFVFTLVKDSSPASADIIHDFNGKEHDRIDLHAIDANTGKSGNQAFDFIGRHAFDHHAGELRVETADHSTWIYADRNGDGNVDFAIHLQGDVPLKTGYFDL